MKALRICLAASGGGHVRQLLDLHPVWHDLNFFFVTEPTALGHSIAADHPAYFVEHFAWGQARLGQWRAMLRSALSNLRQSWTVIWRERPDVIITTGAGSMAPLLLFGRLTGARIILIDSFARFQSPSLFARLAGPLAHARLSQSAASGAKWRGALVFDPFRLIDAPRPPKQELLFATVGATLPFPRLVDWIERAHFEKILPPQVILQVGTGGRRIAGLTCHETLDYADVGSILDQADVVVCHGGTGSIITALQRGCHVIVVPREFSRGEHYDDHQREIADAFAARGLLQVAADYDAFVSALAATAAREPVMATTNPDALADWLRAYLASIGKHRHA